MNYVAGLMIINLFSNTIGTVLFNGLYYSVYYSAKGVYVAVITANNVASGYFNQSPDHTTIETEDFIELIRATSPISV
jgi:hypothetical protein